MKKTVLILAAAAFAGIVSAQSAAITKIDSTLDKKGLLNNASPKPHCTLVFQEKGGVTGGCYKAELGAEAKGSLIVAFNSPSFLPITNSASPISLKVQVKGKGAMRITMLIYDKNKRYFTQTDKSFKDLDTKGEWQTVESVLTPDPKNSNYLSKAAFVSPTIIVDKGSYLIDNWQAEIKTPSAKIKLDD